MVALLEYATAVTPALKSDIRLLPELADSVVVLAVSRLDAFFIDVVSLGLDTARNSSVGTSPRTDSRARCLATCRPS